MASNNQQGAKLVVYWLENSRANRITWLLEELNLEYEIKTFKRNQHKRAPEELKKIHPLGKSPVLGITPAGSDKETIIAESATIVEYVCDHFGKHLIPKKYPEGKEGELCAETEEWLRYRFLMDFTEGSLFTWLFAALIPAGIKKAPVPFFIKPIVRGVGDKIESSLVDPELKIHFDFLEDYLAKSPSNGEFFCGTDISGADIMLHFALEGAAQRVPLDEKSYPGLYAYMRRMQQRPAYTRAGETIAKVTGEPFVPFSDVKFM